MASSSVDLGHSDGADERARMRLACFAASFVTRRFCRRRRSSLCDEAEDTSLCAEAEDEDEFVVEEEEEKINKEYEDFTGVELPAVEELTPVLEVPTSLEELVPPIEELPKVEDLIPVLEL